MFRAELAPQGESGELGGPQTCEREPISRAQGCTPVDSQNRTQQGELLLLLLLLLVVVVLVLLLAGWWWCCWL